MDDLTKTDQSIELCYPSSQRSLNQQENVSRQPIDFSLRSLSQDSFEQIDPQRSNLLRSSLSANSKLDTNCNSLKNKIRKLKNSIIRKITHTKSVEILRVVNTCQTNLGVFEWGWLNPPVQNTELRGFSIPIGGWIVGRDAQPTMIKITCNQEILAEIPVNIPRPDVTKAHFFQHVNCGYSTLLDVTSLPNKAEIVLLAVFSNGDTAVAGSIRICKYS
ncbi:MAG: hypothetical protein ACKO7W_04030 [Elainella sp.]